MVSGEKFVTGLIAGTVIGAAVGLLLAPKSGDETRKVVREKADDLKQRAEEYVSTLRERFSRDQEELTLAEEHSENGIHRPS